MRRHEVGGYQDIAEQPRRHRHEKKQRGLSHRCLSASGPLNKTVGSKKPWVPVGQGPVPCRPAEDGASALHKFIGRNLAATVGEEIDEVRSAWSAGLVTSKPCVAMTDAGSWLITLRPSDSSQTPRLSMKDASTDRFLTISRSMPKVVCKKRAGLPLFGTVKFGGDWIEPGPG